MKKILIVALIYNAIFFIMGCSDTKSILSGEPDGVYAALKVNGQVMLIQLHYQETPMTTMNFVGLATGKFSEHVTREGNFYDGIVFHRVVEDFVIQGGDPEGNGSGGPGYSFPDEFDENLKHDGAGVLSMANSGPNTNGSQFFITMGVLPNLDGRHSVFGKVVKGTDIISTVKQDDTIDSVKIYAKGSEAEEFVENVSWDNFQALIDGIQEERSQKVVKLKAKNLEELNSNNNFQKTEDGIFYQVLTAGTGRNIKEGDKVEVHYELKLYGSDTLLDSSYERNSTFTLEVGANSVIRGWELILLILKKDEVARVIIPPELAYGSRGVPGVIPPESFLDFKMEVINIE